MKRLHRSSTSLRARFAETQVKKALYTDVVSLKDRALPTDGHTEV